MLCLPDFVLEIYFLEICMIYLYSFMYLVGLMYTLWSLPFNVHSKVVDSFHNIICLSLAHYMKVWEDIERSQSQLCLRFEKCWMECDKNCCCCCGYFCCIFCKGTWPDNALKVRVLCDVWCCVWTLHLAWFWGSYYSYEYLEIKALN